jgi:hypothetical protein
MKPIINSCLWIALGCASFTLLLKIVVGPVESYGFNFFSVFISFFILLFSLVSMAVILIKGRFRKEIFKGIKTGIFLFLATICILALAGLVS